MYITLRNGKKIYGQTWKELLKNLKNSTYYKQTMDEYMAGVAARAQTMDGSKLQYTDEETFLKELERIKAITITMEMVRRKIT